MCFIKQVEQESKVKFKGLGFFDFDAYEANGKHVVNLAMAKRICKLCYEANTTCLLCEKQYKFYDIESFVDWLKADGNKDFIWNAHNGKSYDTQFVLQFMYRNAIPTDPYIKIIRNGTKIMELRYKTFVIRDSSLFIPMSLS
jgi:hypothetical protein